MKWFVKVFNSVINAINYGNKNFHMGFDGDNVSP